MDEVYYCVRYYCAKQQWREEQEDHIPLQCCSDSVGRTFALHFVDRDSILGRVCFGFFIPLKYFSLNWRRHHYWWRATNFDQNSALMVIELWGFFKVQHLLWHGSNVYNGHLRGPVTLAPIAERLAVELSLPVLFT